jgi:hypothetical protein
MSNPFPLPTARCSQRMAELRASVAADAPRGRLAREVQKMFLFVFEMLLKMLADWKEKSLSPGAARMDPGAQPGETWGPQPAHNEAPWSAASAPCATGAACAGLTPRPSPAPHGEREIRSPAHESREQCAAAAAGATAPVRVAPFPRFHRRRAWPRRAARSPTALRRGPCGLHSGIPGVVLIPFQKTALPGACLCTSNLLRYRNKIQ